MSLFNTGKAIVSRGDHHDECSGDGGPRQGGVIHKVSSEKNECELIGVVKNRNTRRRD